MLVVFHKVLDRRRRFYRLLQEVWLTGWAGRSVHLVHVRVHASGRRGLRRCSAHAVHQTKKDELWWGPDGGQKHATGPKPQVPRLQPSLLHTLIALKPVACTSSVDDGRRKHDESRTDFAISRPPPPMLNKLCRPNKKGKKKIFVDHLQLATGNSFCNLLSDF